MQVTAATHDAADREMARLLAEGYDDVMALLQRNRGALDATIDALLDQTTMSGQEVRPGSPAPFRFLLTFAAGRLASWKP